MDGRSIFNMILNWTPTGGWRRHEILCEKVVNVGPGRVSEREDRLPLDLSNIECPLCERKECEC